MTATLQIDLQEGFSGDEVIILTDGQEVYHQFDVTTKLLLGYADVVKVEVSLGPVNIEISVLTRQITRTESLSIPHDRYLGASVRNNEIDIIKSEMPFGYG